MSLREIVRSRIVDLRLQFEQRRAAMQPQQNQVTTYLVSQNSQEKRAIPAYGADSSGFGEEWAFHRSPPVKLLTEPLPLENKTNYHGFIAGKGEPPIPAERPFEDPMISRGFKRTSETTDQQPIKSFHGEMSDKPITLQVEKKKDFQSVRKTSEPTVGDQHALDLKKYPFDFSF